MEPDIGPGLHSDEETDSLNGHEEGKHSKQRLQSFRVGGVQLGEEPVRSSLEDKELLHLVGNLGHDLDSRGGRADQADSLASDVDTMVPLGGVEAGASEGLHSFYLRQDWAVESSTGGYEEPGLENSSGRDHPPHRLLLPPAGRHHGRPQLDVREEGELLCEGHQILLYFLGRSYESEIILSTEVEVAGGGASSPGPVRVGEECYLVERSPDITGTASGGDR